MHPQLDVPKPLGLKFARGNDGGAYIIENNPAAGNTDPRIQVNAAVHTSAPASNTKGMNRLAHKILLAADSTAHRTCYSCAQPGDKVVQISASFGSEVWDAQNFGQVKASSCRHSSSSDTSAPVWHTSSLSTQAELDGLVINSHPWLASISKHV